MKLVNILRLLLLGRKNPHQYCRELSSGGLNKDDQTDSSMIETDTPNDFRLEVTVKKADLYNLKGEKVSDHLTKGTVCTIGNEDEFTQSTYYKASSKDKLVQLNESSWL